MGLEFELKYKADPAAQERIFRDLGPWDTTEMRTTYYDTPSGALAARKFTLRCRLENGTPVCTVKTPAGDQARGEWELTGQADIRKAIPVLCDMGAPRELLGLTQEGLEPICGAEFTRQAARIIEADATLELALDRGFLFAGETRLDLCEVEVELKSGNRETAVAWGALLAARYGLTPEPKSKFKRALELLNN